MNPTSIIAVFLIFLVACTSALAADPPVVPANGEQSHDAIERGMLLDAWQMQQRIPKPESWTTTLSTTGAWTIAGSATVPCHSSDAIWKYVAFARTLLTDNDEATRARALSVVLLDEPSDAVQLARKALNDGSSEMCRWVLGSISGRVSSECVPAIRKLLEKNSHPNPELHGDDESIDASLAAQALLESHDQEGREQAIDWIEAGLKQPSNLGRWELAVGLVGKYRLSQLKAYLTGEKIQGDQKVTAAAALAKLGNVPSQQYLRTKITDPQFFYFIVSDLEIVKLLRLRQEDIENAVSREKRAESEKQQNPGDRDAHLDAAETATARARAYLGHPEQLRGLGGQLRELARANTVRSREKLLMILFAIGEVGDKSMITTLERFFVEAPKNLWKLEASLAIVRISQRERAKTLNVPIGERRQ